MSTLPAGLIDSNVELFSAGKFKLNALHNGKVVGFEQLPQAYLVAMSTFLAQLLGCPSEHVEADAWCLFGGFDNTADMDTATGRFTPEYWECGLRGSCPKEKKLCLQSPNTPSGRPLSRRELQYIKLRALGHSHAEVASIMGVAENTLPAMYNHIKEKFMPPGVENIAPDHNFLTRYAINNNLI